MEKMLYGVSTGEYSDWSIMAVFDDEDIAKKYSAVKHANTFITEIPLNPEFDEKLVDKRHTYHLHMDKNGDVYNIHMMSEYSSTESKSSISKWGEGFFICVKADTEEEAVKIAGEKRRMFIANDYKFEPWD